METQLQSLLLIFSTLELFGSRLLFGSFSLKKVSYLQNVQTDSLSDAVSEVMMDFGFRL